MKEKIYSIPVNDAFKSDCECPVCNMYQVLEDNAVEYTMGPSYMEDDTRALTDESGFCRRHMEMVYESGNKLGISLILKTHFDKVIRDVAALPKGEPVKRGLFARKSENEENPVVAYLNKVNSSCFVCNRINNVFERYIDTIFYLWKNEPDFRKLFSESKGFCNQHFSMLLSKAPQHLSEKRLEEFNEELYRLYMDNMERVRDDLEWFINKFDYRYEKEPWKNAKDSIPRAMIKTNGIIMKEK